MFCVFILFLSSTAVEPLYVACSWCLVEPIVCYTPNDVPLQPQRMCMTRQVQKTCQRYMKRLRLRRESDVRRRAQAEAVKLHSKVSMPRHNYYM